MQTHVVCVYFLKGDRGPRGGNGDKGERGDEVIFDMALLLCTLHIRSRSVPLSVTVTLAVVIFHF